MLELFGTLPEKVLKTREMSNMLDILDVWGEPPPPFRGQKFNIFNISRVSSLVLKTFNISPVL